VSNRKEADMRLRIAVFAALLMVLCSGAVASADDRGGRGRPDFIPVHRLGGASGAELIGQWWARVLEIPNAQNPLGAGTTAMCLDLGRRGQVVAPVGTAQQDATCTVRAGQAVYLQLTSAECSSNEPDPFHGVTEAEQRTCAINWARTAPVSAYTLSLDGAAAVNVLDERFFLVSPQLRSVFDVADPAFDATPGPTTFVAAGYAATPRHLRRGQHVIAGTVVLTDGNPPVTFTITLNVVRRGHH
jgi:hypothetical protein